MSDKVWTFGLENFPRHAPKVFDRLVAAVLVEARDELALRWLPLAIRLTPIGGIMSKARRDRAPGLMQRSWRWKIGRGGAKQLSNPAPHSFVIDRGRKRGVTPTTSKKRVRARRGETLATNPRARMLGSVLAPRGVTRPVWARLNKVERAAISKIAIQKAEASVPTGVAA